MKSKVFQRILDKTPKDVEIFVDWYADIVLRIDELIREKKITKKELAQSLDKQPSEISKWLGGNHNFTLRSLAKLSAELGEPLLQVPKRLSNQEFIQDGYIVRIHTFVSREKIPTESASLEWQPMKEREIYNEQSNVA